MIKNKTTLKTTKWFVYTVLVGLIPFMCRCIVYFVLKEMELSFLIHEADFIVFGLVLHITNINELEHSKLVGKNQDWKTIHNGFSVVFLVLYGVIFALSLLKVQYEELFDEEKLKFSSFCLSCMSFYFSYSIYKKLPKLTLNHLR